VNGPKKGLTWLENGALRRFLEAIKRTPRRKKLSSIRWAIQSAPEKEKTTQKKREKNGQKVPPVRVKDSNLSSSETTYPAGLKVTINSEKRQGKFTRGGEKKCQASARGKKNCKDGSK